MTNEEFNRQKEDLSSELGWEALIRLYRRYVGECRQDGDLDNLAEALDGLERSSQTEPDPYADPSVIDSCRQLLSECDGTRHPDDYYWQWLI